MRLLDISTDLGPAATPEHLEALVKGIRVVTQVAREADTRRLRRAISERMKYPTDSELRSAVERLPQGDETGPQYRARQQLEVREFFGHEIRRHPPELWYDFFYRWSRSEKGSAGFAALSSAGFDRVVATPFPLAGSVGLDVLDPVLYDALVTDEMARSLPGEIGVTALSYENPFWTRLFGKGNAEKTVSTAVQVIEVARDFGSQRKMAKADATVAEAVVDNRIEESELDVAIKRERLREARLRNDRRALENAFLQASLGADQQRRRLVDQAVRIGQLDIGDAIQALDSGEAQALGELGRRKLEVVQDWVQDDPDLDD